MHVDPETVDIQIPICTQDMDEQETTISRNFVYFVYLIKNIRRMNDIHQKLKANPSWRNDPQFTDCGPIIDSWALALPPNLLVVVPTDLSIPCPQVEHHYVANLQIYHNLAKLMVHRPPLSVTKTFTSRGQWREHMSICSNSAKNICRLTEVVWGQFGMAGLQCMMRGINFTIYANLTATMIHLVGSLPIIIITREITNFCRLRRHAQIRISIQMQKNTLPDLCGYWRIALIFRPRQRQKARYKH